MSFEVAEDYSTDLGHEEDTGLDVPITAGQDFEMKPLHPLSNSEAGYTTKFVFLLELL